MRWSWAAALLVLPLFGGCLDVLDRDPGGDHGVAPADVGFDPDSISVTGVEKRPHTVPSFDETPLSLVVYEPQTTDHLPDGSPPTWGTVVFLHGWGTMKEIYEGVAGATGAPAQAEAATSELPTAGSNRLQQFAEQGLIAAAYDARGFGQSGGTAMVASQAEMADLGAILDFLSANYPTNGRFGLVGQSYGAGQAYLAWADDPRVTTIVPMYGWVDLYDGLAQGDVPKLSWAATLLGAGAAGGKGKVSPELAGWYQKAVGRAELAEVEAAMDLRSVEPRLAGVRKPLLVCQGLQETLFPQADRAWQAAGGFTRAVVSTGGHGLQDGRCYARAVDWMLYFLAGHDTGVDGWPALASVDADGSAPLDYTTFPRSAVKASYLAGPVMAANASDATFTVSQRLLSNPIAEPPVLYDLAGQALNQVPEQLRQDPTAVFFETPAFTGSEVLLGAPVLRLVPSDPAGVPPYQVVGTLYHVTASGQSRALSHAAAADLVRDGDTPNEVLELRFWWTKTDLATGDKLVLKLGANDAGLWAPLLANYEVEFTGASALDLPFFEG